MVEAMYERSPEYYKQFRKNFRFFIYKEKPKLGVDFPQNAVVSIGLHSPVHDLFCNALSENHYHVLAQCFSESYKGQPKSYLLPCLYTTYAQLISNCEEKEQYGEIFEKLDQAIVYNGDLQAVNGHKNLKKLLPSVCFSVQRCDKAVQVNFGPSQTTMRRLEDVVLGPYGGHLLMIADIFQTGFGSIDVSPTLTFSLNENVL